MKRFWNIALAVLLTMTLPSVTEARQWTLQECIDYALENNISLQKTRITKLSAQEDILQSKAALLPSLDFSTSHNVAWRPWQESGTATVANGTVETSVDKVYYNGSYGVNANWTVWNGNRNRNQVKLDEITYQQAALDSAETANSIIEQIVQLYVQILYSKEAISVNKESLELSQTNEQRGKVMVDVGKMSKADLAQLTAQRATDEYNVVAAESALGNYKRQLKQLLEITNDEEFDVVSSEATDAQALRAIPAVTTVYEAALDTRPEIQNTKLTLQSSDLNIKIAEAQRLPTVGLTAGVGTNTTTLSSTAWGSQLKTNFDASAGVTVSIPLFDNRSTKTAVNKARLQQQSSLLELRDQQTTLYSTIENYWLNATTNQNQFKAARVNVESEQTSYDLLSEQFRLGLKNIVELKTGKVNLLTAKQNELQSKYLTIYNIDMLEFYKDGTVKR